jgi:phosphatidylglycerol:prolipoprotein diacylglycerol transferase
VNYYGLLITAGILVCLWVAEKVKPSILRKVDIFDVLAFVLLPAIIGARIYHVLDFWKAYYRNPFTILYIWKGGLGIWGAVAGGILGIIFYSQVEDLKKEQKTALLNLAAFVLPLGQAVGRFGNFFNQELYGKPTNLPWGIYISPENRIPRFQKSSCYHPLFIYESLLNLIIFIFFMYLLRFKKIKITSGIYLFLYLLLYSFARFFLDFLRIRNWSINIPLGDVIPVSQLNSVNLIIYSFISIFNMKDKLRM